MVTDSANSNWLAFQAAQGRREIRMHLRSEIEGLQKRGSILGREDDVNQNERERLRHFCDYTIFRCVDNPETSALSGRLLGGGFPGVKPLDAPKACSWLNPRAESWSPSGQESKSARPKMPVKSNLFGSSEPLQENFKSEESSTRTLFGWGQT
jgi:hypothetical protein